MCFITLCGGWQRPHQGPAVWCDVDQAVRVEVSDNVSVSEITTRLPACFIWPNGWTVHSLGNAPVVWLLLLCDGGHKACCVSVLGRCHTDPLLVLECSDHCTSYMCGESHPPTQGMCQGLVGGFYPQLSLGLLSFWAPPGCLLRVLIAPSCSPTLSQNIKCWQNRFLIWIQNPTFEQPWMLTDCQGWKASPEVWGTQVWNSCIAKGSV